MESLVEKWVYFIKNAENLRLIPSNIDDEGLKSAYTEADKHTWTRKDLEAYDYALMREADGITEKMLVVQKAELAKQIEIAKNLIALGLNNDLIVKGTDLTVEEVQDLRTQKII